MPTPDADVAGLRKFVSPEFVLGTGARRLVARYARNLGARRALVVTDAGVLEAGWGRAVLEDLEADGLELTIFDRMTSNPKDEEVMEGARVCSEAACNLVVAVGGGSPIDCAKGIGIIVSNLGHILDYEGIDRIEHPIPPLICVPTTGSGADVSQFAIVTDSRAGVKRAVVSKAIIPDISLVDPETLMTLPRSFRANSLVDALAHCMESYVSVASSPMTDLFALDAMERLARWGARFVNEPRDADAAREVMLGSLQAGLAFSNASLGAVHALAHSLGGKTGAAHGSCNRLLILAVTEFNFDSAPERYGRIAQVIGARLPRDLREYPANPRLREEVKGSLLQRLDEFSRELGDEPRPCAVPKAEIPELARQALADPCMVTNPRRPTVSEIQRLYERVL